jgi:hypothetical protein
MRVKKITFYFVILAGKNKNPEISFRNFTTLVLFAQDRKENRETSGFIGEVSTFVIRSVRSGLW